MIGFCFILFCCVLFGVVCAFSVLVVACCVFCSVEWVCVAVLFDFVIVLCVLCCVCCCAVVLFYV